MALNDCGNTTEGHEERTGITPTMEAAILDDYNCDYYCDCNYFKEYHDFLECFKDFGGNPQTTVEQILTRMKAAEKPARLLESFMSSSSRGKSWNMYEFSVV